MASHAVIYYTHFVTEAVHREITHLSQELGGDFKIFAVGCCPDEGTLNGLASESIEVWSYTRDDMRTLPYARQLAGVNWETMRHNPDLAIMRFFRRDPGFDYYWIVEYDVRFTGSWKNLFADLNESSADLLCTHVTTFKQGREWLHWNSFSAAGEDVDMEEDLIRAFFPFCRMSKTLMQAIDERCTRGWTGHPEVLWPTIARAIGAKIEDIGGTGPFVPDTRRGKYYHSAVTPSGLFLSTFGAWPAFYNNSKYRLTLLPDILWHPVKE